MYNKTVLDIRREVNKIVCNTSISNLVNRYSYLRGKNEIKNKDEVNEIWRFLIQVDKEWDKRKDKLLGYTFYDGYIVPLEHTTWLRVLRSQGKIIGCVFYIKGVAIRVLEDKKGSGFIQDNFIYINIRGVG